MTKYETNFHQWAFEQAQRLRSGEPVDVENVAEECEHQPERRTAGWDANIKEQRRRIARLLDQNPSLEPKLPDCVRDAYATAVTFASVETGMIEEDFPAGCPYPLDHILPA
jgi:hypothetical protein